MDAVHSYISKLNYIKTYNYAKAEQGGHGVTELLL